MAEPAPLPPVEKEPASKRLEALVLVPNLVLVALIGFYLVVMQARDDGPAPLVEGDRRTEAQIAQLELELLREPTDVSKAVQLARLYRQVGEFPWSYNALLAAERQGSQQPRWRLMLALAFLELGKNEDAKRVLSWTGETCRRQPARCDANLRAKVVLFSQLVTRYIEQGIDSRRHPEKAERALKEVLKPVQVDPDKMRPKAPVGPEPASAPAREPKG